MNAHIATREKATGAPNPMYTNLNWHGSASHEGPFETSQQAYDSLHIGSVGAANRLQSGNKRKQPRKLKSDNLSLIANNPHFAPFYPRVERVIFASDHSVPHHNTLKLFAFPVDMINIT